MIARASARMCQRQLKRTYASVFAPQFGQPDPSSHPHLFSSSNELTPGITKEEYHSRRKRLMESLPDGSIAILRAASIKYMSKNIFYRFRQASDFWYLTGFEEPDSIAVLEKTRSTKGYRMTFFCAPKEAKKELWDGPMTGLDGAMRHFGADAAHEIGELSIHLPKLISPSSYVYADITNASSISISKSPRKSFMAYLNPASTYHPIRSTSTPPGARVSSEIDGMILQFGERKRRDLSNEVALLRKVKSPAERRLMKGAAKKSARAHALTMQYARPGLSEADLESYFQHICASTYDGKDDFGIGGCQRPAYVPVVASGRNALTIHHTSNNQLICENELVLIDAGGEWNGYASDITRTFPVSGTFTKAQRALYQAVLNVQKKCVSVLCTGSPFPNTAFTELKGGEEARITLPALHRLSARFLVEELVSLGFKLDPHGREIEELYPHLVGHGVGIDLHETSGMRSEELVDGQVVTVEPGVYVPANKRYPQEFHNIGIRIEDEVLIAKDHGVVLSVDAPKEIEDVEAVCQGKVLIH